MAIIPFIIEIKRLSFTCRSAISLPSFSDSLSHKVDVLEMRR